MTARESSPARPFETRRADEGGPTDDVGAADYGKLYNRGSSARQSGAMRAAVLVGGGTAADHGAGLASSSP